jgi:DNA processing protein
MALKTEFILTLQQLKGIGVKTILDIAKSIDYNIETIDELCNFWSRLKGRKFEKIISDDIYIANRNAIRIIEASKRDGIGIISYFEKEFPTILKHCINEDGKEEPVILLYFRGDLKALEKPGVAIIGTREPTDNGIKAGKYFASELAKENFNIVSGLAIGCDTTAHQGALSVQGTTTAFLANGLDWNSIYPKENLELAKQIVANGGLLLSEYSIGQACNRYALVARDRLQAALSYATIAIQTGVKGGTMHAVNTTIVSHKPLFMVEYKNDTDNSHEKVQGNNKLIQEKKAHPLRSDNLKASIGIIDSYIDQSKKNSEFKNTIF